MTPFIKKKDTKKDWYIINAQNAVVGRLAAYISKVLRGKNKAQFNPHIDNGDFVVVTNVDKLRFTGKKFLNRSLVELDKRLLENYYKNNGYYNAKINSSFAKLVNKNEFELIFNIDAKSKVFFGDLTLNLPNDFDEKNFLSIKKLFKKIKGDHYSINSIDKILVKLLPSIFCMGRRIVLRKIN